MFLYDYREIIIYVLNNVDINVLSISLYLFVYDNVVLNIIIYKIFYGGFSRVIIENKVNRLENLNLIFNNNFYLLIKLILGVKNVNIELELLYIFLENEDVFINNIEEYIFENVNIKEKIGRNLNYESEFYLYFDMLIVKFLDIEVLNFKVRFDILVNKYKFNCDIKLKEVIEEFNNDEEYDNDLYDYEYDEEYSNKYRNMREIKGFLNKNLLNLEKEYIIKINLNSLEL